MYTYTYKYLNKIKNRQHRICYNQKKPSDKTQPYCTPATGKNVNNNFAT